jgi:hypothetical protein
MSRSVTGKAMARTTLASGWATAYVDASASAAMMLKETRKPRLRV